MPTASVDRLRSLDIAWSRLRAKPPPEPDPFPAIRLGDTGSTVALAQQMLAALGFGPVGEAGVFDTPTRTAVERFQMGHSLPTTGTIGAAEWQVLLTIRPSEPDEAWVSALAAMRATDGIGERAVLREGAKGSEVRYLQDRLVSLGYGPVAVDGDFGPATAAAVRRLQAARGLIADGAVGRATWAVIEPSPAEPHVAPPDMPLLATGARGEEVARLQERLVELGFGPLATDGRFGPGTVAAVKRFQQAAGLVADGIVGPSTWARVATGDVPAPPSLLGDTKAALDALARAAFPSGSPLAGTVLPVLLTAIGTVGAREKPDGSNGGPDIAAMVDGYYSPEVERASGKPPWCALAVSWWVRQGLGLRTYAEGPFSARFGSADQFRQWGIRHGRFVPAPMSVAPPGAVFVMEREGSGSDDGTSSGRSGHCGIVIADEGDHVRTVDGNVSNAVGTRRRRKTTLQGFVIWW